MEHRFRHPPRWREAERHLQVGEELENFGWDGLPWRQEEGVHGRAVRCDPHDQSHVRVQIRGLDEDLAGVLAQYNGRPPTARRTSHVCLINVEYKCRIAPMLEN